MPLTLLQRRAGPGKLVEGSSSTVIQSGVSGRGRSPGAKGSIHLMTSSTATRASRHGISRGRCLTAAGGVPESLRACFPSFPQIYLYYSRVLPRRLYGFLRFASAPAGSARSAGQKAPGRPGAGLWFAEGLVEGRLYLGQKADKGDGLQCVILRRKITHCIHRDGGRLRQRVAVHPGGDGGKGHRPAAVLHGQGQAAPVAGGQELRLSVAAPFQMGPGV